MLVRRRELGGFPGAVTQTVELDQPTHHDNRGRTMSTATISQQLERQLARCCSPRRHATITARWATEHPALDGLSIDDIRACCRRKTPEQNPIVAALISLHQHGDTDASTVLMTVCEPLIVKIAHQTRRTSTTGDDHLDAMWAALGHTLAVIDPDAVVDVDTNACLVNIATWVSACRRQLCANERQHYRSGRHLRTVELSAAILDSPHCGLSSDPHGVEDETIRRLELADIARAVRDGVIDRDDWNDLVEHRISKTTPTTLPARDRVAIHRTGRRLARLVDHAA